MIHQDIRQKNRGDICKTAMASSVLLRVLLAIGGRSLFMGLLIFAIFAAILLPPYLLGLVVDPQ